MEKPVLAADASRKFSKLLREVREGKSYVVTSHGRAVARIVPAEKDIGVTRAARAALLKDSGPSQWLQSAVGGGMNFMRIKNDAVILGRRGKRMSFASFPGLTRRIHLERRYSHKSVCTQEK